MTALYAGLSARVNRFLFWEQGLSADRVTTDAEADLESGKADLIAIGKGFLANPDLVARWKAKAALNSPDPTTFYTPGAKGYTDYPALVA